MKGKLYGVGIGPGDENLLTLKAVQVLNEVDVIFAPVSHSDKSTAYEIVKNHIPENKKVEFVKTAMSKKTNKTQMYQEIVEQIEEYLEQALNVAFITLGDPTIYSTYIYIHQMIEQKAYDVEIIPGITSFCAGAAKLNIALCENEQTLTIIPATHTSLEDIFKVKGPKVLMKHGEGLKEILAYLKANQTKYESYLVERLGMENERIIKDINQISEKTSYFTILYIKERD